MSTDNSSVLVEEGFDLSDAWGLPTPPIPERQIDKMILQCGDYLGDLDKLASSSGAKETPERADKYRKELVDLTKKAAKNKKEAKLVSEAVDLLVKIRGELAVPAREEGVNKAIAEFKLHAGPLGKSKASEFEKSRDKVAKEKDAVKRCDAYYELERDIIKADLYFREQTKPGSTWQTQVEFAVGDALPGGDSKKKKSPLSLDEWKQMGKSFAASMNKKIDDMAFSVAPDDVDQFKKEALAAIKEVQDEYFSDERLPETQQKLGKALMVANMNAMQALSTLKRDYPPDTTPQVFVSDGKLTVAKQAPKLESLVLQGGGGKGVGYPAMLEEMNKSGMLDSVDLLVGTSIGALNASCLACGGLEDEREILNIGITKQAFDMPGFKKKYPGVKFGKDVYPTCAGEMAKIDEMTSKSIGEKLKSRSEDQLTDDLVERLRDLDDDALARLGLANADDATIVKTVQNLAKKVKHQDFGASDRTMQMITFRDLALLHQLDPKNFKELTITGWEGTGKDGKSVYFNAEDFGDMPIAIAARVSMGLPIFSPLYWNGRGPFYDGGIGSNAPTEATPGLKKFYDDNEPGDAEEILKGDDIPLEIQQAMQKTMLMTFDEDGTASDKLHGTGRQTAGPNMGEKITVLKKGQVSDAINPEYAKALKDDAGKVYNSGVNTFQVFHGNQGTMSLGVLGGNPEEIEYAENIARMKGIEQIDQRTDQAVAVSCKSADEALSTLSPAEMQKFVDAGIPDSADAMVKELFAKCQAYLDLDYVAKQAKSTGDSTTFVNELVASILTRDCQAQASHLQDAYKTIVKGNVSPDALKNEVGSTKGAIEGLSTYLQPMLKATVLVPLQQKIRALGKDSSQDTSNEPLPSFVWKRDFAAATFDETVRTAAKAGVFLKTKDADKVYSALKDFEKAEKKQFDLKKKPKDRVKAAREALTKLDVLARSIQAMSAADEYKTNATMQKYLGWLGERCRADEVPLRSIVKGAAVDFPANTFKAWDSKDWQKNKKAAVNAGVLEDYGATGLGEAIDDAEKAAKTAGKSTKPDDKLSTGRDAWKAWDQVIRAAKGVQSHTENPNFSAYLEDCVTKATGERDKFPAP
jgi:predicted acylesterase/phospholipase RssA